MRSRKQTTYLSAVCWRSDWRLNHSCTKWGNLLRQPVFLHLYFLNRKHIFKCCSSGNDMQFSQQRVETMCFLTSIFQLPGGPPPASSPFRLFRERELCCVAPHFSFVNHPYLIHVMPATWATRMKIETGRWNHRGAAHDQLGCSNRTQWNQADIGVNEASSNV